MNPTATVNTMEVLETRPISDLVTEAIIKVCYVSNEPNANQTIISYETGKMIASTLPGAPVVGFFNKETNDFEQHSREIVFKDGEVEFEDITKPYGFVSPMDNPWYQSFSEEGVSRTYLMCKAYLWTRQYEEATLALNKGQSMELDEKTMSGYFQGDVFVFTSATLDKLCILGDAFAPCFSGAKIMTAYAKQYETLAEKLEKTIGRRYYIMNNKLAPKNVTLDYAIELGWDLTSAIYNQLEDRGMAGYDVEGVYEEDGSIFAIVKDRTTAEYSKIGVSLSAEGSVTLGTVLEPVKLVWIPKLPPVVEPAAPLNGEDAISVQEIPLNVQSTFAEEPEGDDPASVSDSIEKEVSEESVVENAEPAVDFAALCETKKAEIIQLNEKVGEYSATIQSLEKEISAYKIKDEELLVKEKEKLIQSYSALLSEEEIATVQGTISNFSLNEIEAQLAITYAHNQQDASAAAPTQFQLNINAQVAPEANVPEYFKQAMEYDRQKKLKLI